MAPRRSTPHSARSCRPALLLFSRSSSRCNPPLPHLALPQTSISPTRRSISFVSTGPRSPDWRSSTRPRDLRARPGSTRSASCRPSRTSTTTQRSLRRARSTPVATPDPTAAPTAAPTPTSQPAPTPSPTVDPSATPPVTQTSTASPDPGPAAAVYPREVNADELWSQGTTGRGVTVAVLDSGVAADPDLVTPSSRILASVNFADQRSTADPGGHGTHVAGIIAGNGTRSAGEFVGVAPEAFTDRILREKV